jgi:hypothetical protein
VEVWATMYAVTKPRCYLQRRPVLVAFCCAAMLSQGCARRDPLHSADGVSAVNRENLPFHSESQETSSGSGSSRPAIPTDPKVTGGVPFHGSQPILLPTGTLLTVQLVGSLSASKVHSGDAFSAAVAVPVSLDGITLVSRGTLVSGRVESAQSEIDREGALGYFQLSLNAIMIAGRAVALQTSSLYARGTAPRWNLSSGSTNMSTNIRIQKGRRLTFRLTAPVTVEAKANREITGSMTTE